MTQDLFNAETDPTACKQRIEQLKLRIAFNKVSIKHIKHCLENFDEDISTTSLYGRAVVEKQIQYENILRKFQAKRNAYLCELRKLKTLY